MDAINERIALLGLSPRQRRLLDLEAILEGTAYDALDDWDAVDAKGDPLPCRQRKPSVQTGYIAEAATKLVRRLTGRNMLPEISGVDAVQTELDQTQWWKSLPMVVRNLLRGSAAWGFSRLASGRWEPLRIDPTWAEPLFVSQANGPRGRQLADELALLGVRLPQPDPDAESHDLLFLRHEWVRDEELAVTSGGQARRTRRTRYRRDYLPDVIIEYRPIEMLSDSSATPVFELAEQPRPHRWGVVPIVWLRSPGAKDGEPEGSSFVSSFIESLEREADYIESFAGESVRKLALPQLATIDLRDKVSDVNAEFDPTIPRTQPSGSKYVLEFSSSSLQGQQGKAEILEIQGTGVKAAADYVDRLARRIERLTGMIEYDQSAASGTLSGQALERMLEPMISTVEEWRGTIEDAATLYARKLAKAARKATVDPQVTWPRVVASTPADWVAAVQALTTATGGAPVISQETAARLFAQVAALPDAEAEIKALAKDAEASLQQAREALSASRPQAVAKVDGSAGDPAKPDATSPAKVTAGVSDVQKTALNGAQVQALQQVVQAIARKELPIAVGREIILAAFDIAPEDVDKMLAPLKTFEPPPDPAPAAPGPTPPVA